MSLCNIHISAGQVSMMDDGRDEMVLVSSFGPSFRTAGKDTQALPGRGRDEGSVLRSMVTEQVSGGLLQLAGR